MFKNYLKTAWRNLIRNKAFSSINIFGLALGITCSLIILLWVQDERSIDSFHANGKQLYQVYERMQYDGKVEASYTTQGLLAEELKRVIPEIQYASSLERSAALGSSDTFEAGEKINKMEGSFVGSDFFSMFSYPLLQGTRTTALNTPSAIAISRKMAEIFFGSPEKAIGKTLRYNNKEDLQVTVVFENVPQNSSQQFDFLRCWTDFVKANKWVHNWSNTSPETLIQLRKDADPVKVEAKIKNFIYKYVAKDQGFITELGLQPYPEKYLHSTFKNGQIDGGRIEYIRLFTLVAVFILLIACINFMNLATARSVKRAKEVGLRKVIGAVRSALIVQFIGEAILLTFLSAIVAVILTILLLPAFNNIIGKQLSIPTNQPLFWLALTVLLTITGFVAGSYPALFMSSLKPSSVLKGSLKFSPNATLFRQVLVVFQFTLSIILIIGMIVIYRQINFIQTKNLGYNRDNLIYITIEGELSTKYDLLKAEAEKMPGILSISKMRNSPTVIEHHISDISWPGKDPNLTVSFADAVVGYDFVKTMDLKVKNGRDFSKSFGTDSAAYLLNETAVQKMNYKAPVGQIINRGNHPGKIIGVIKDFHFNSMHAAIDPLIVRLDENWTWGIILVRVKSNSVKNTIDGLEQIYKSLNPKFPFTYQFSDQEFAKLYKSEAILSELFNYFAFLAIMISSLGLFGLAAFTATQRTKEIGIRKVLGASVPHIVGLLSKDFIKLVFIAILVASPLAWFLMYKWLLNYSYRINISWWIFASAGIMAIVIALLTISFQAIKAALANPVKSLRSE